MLQVLFVDDEPDVLEGLRDLLHSYRWQWVMRFAASGEDALWQLTTGPADVVVCDLRMPGIDGAAVLNHVSLTAPSTRRIVLSGQADRALEALAADLAHVILTKPCSAMDLEAAINTGARPGC
jgi:CheY-like chemotaxis protein